MQKDPILREVTTIGYEYADGNIFRGDSQYPTTYIKKVILSENVKIISRHAFANCSSLETVTMQPNSVERIETSAFSDCSNLKSIDLPKGLWKIGYFSFYGCNSLEAITIPRSVKNIEESAFRGCFKLTSITMEGETPPALGKFPPFPDTNTGFTIRVPASSIYDYKTAEGWSKYASKIVAK